MEPSVKGPWDCFGCIPAVAKGDEAGRLVTGALPGSIPLAPHRIRF